MNTELTRYQFADLQVCVRGLGVYFGGQHLTDACDKLTQDQLKAANKEAWKQRKAATRLGNAYSNISCHGSMIYERATAHEYVCEVVCKETWKRMGVAA